MFVTVLLAALLTASVASAAAAQSISPPPEAPGDPISTIIDAFRSHDVVALADAHGNELAHAFLISLIRDPRFVAPVNDIVVEFGGARYRDVMDRFIRGDGTPDESLPANEGLLRPVRSVSASPSAEHELRVLLVRFAVREVAQK